MGQGKKFGGGRITEWPFFSALVRYIESHLALDLRNEKVKVIRIACGAFVLGEEGKVKLTQPLARDDGDNPQSRATKRLVNDLVGVAMGGAFSVNET